MDSSLHCYAFLAACWAANLQRSLIALSGYSGLLVAVDVAVDAFGAIITGGFVSAIVAGVVKLAAAWFARWRFFFAAFLEILSMVTKKGKHRCSTFANGEN